MRAWIVGNGPSLSKTPLSLLENEVCFAANRINLIYDQTTWRPTHYVRAEGMELLKQPDPDIWLEDVRTHILMDNCKVWANNYFFKRLDIDPQGEYEKLPHPCTHYLTHYHDENCPHLWHFPMVCTFGSSVNVAIQLAVMEGFDEIYLVGCDLGYQDGIPSHFVKDYENGYEEMLRPANYANLDTLAAHIVARRSAEMIGVKIYNATIGGQLEVYERRAIHEILGDR